MSDKLRAKTYTRREFEQILNDNGYELVRSKGSHFIYRNDKETISVPKKINKMMGRRLVKEYNLI